MNQSQITLVKVLHPINRTDRDIKVVPYNNENLLDIRDMHFPKDIDVVVSVNGEIINPLHLYSTYVKPNDYIVFIPSITGDGGGGGKGIMRIMAMVAVMAVAALTYQWYVAPTVAAQLSAYGTGAEALAYVPALAGGFGGSAFGGAMLASGIMMAGGLLVNALLPPSTPTQNQESSTSQQYSWNPKTRQAQGVPISRVYGVNQLNGNVIATALENIVKGKLFLKYKKSQIINLLLSLGIWRCSPIDGLSNFYINDQSIESYDRLFWNHSPDIEVHQRHGYVNQTAIDDFLNTTAEFSVLRTVPASPDIWKFATIYSVGDVIRPRELKYNGHQYLCIQGGKTSLTTQPTWPTVTNATVVDNGVIWQENGVEGAIEYETEDGDYDGLEVEISFPSGLYDASQGQDLMPYGVKLSVSVIKPDNSVVVLSRGVKGAYAMNYWFNKFPKFYSLFSDLSSTDLFTNRGFGDSLTELNNVWRLANDIKLKADVGSYDYDKGWTVASGVLEHYADSSAVLKLLSTVALSELKRENISYRLVVTFSEFTAGLCTIQVEDNEVLKVDISSYTTNSGIISTDVPIKIEDVANFGYFAIKPSKDARFKISSISMKEIQSTGNSDTDYWTAGYYIQDPTDWNSKLWVYDSITPTPTSTQPSNVYAGKIWGKSEDGTVDYIWQVVNGSMSACTADMVDPYWDTIYGNTTSKVFRSYRYEVTSAGTHTIVVAKITPDKDNIKYGDKLYLDTVREIYYDKFQYPRNTLVGLRAVATDILSGSFDFSCQTNGALLPVYGYTPTNGTGWYIAGREDSSTALGINIPHGNNNPAWVLWDVLTQPVLKDTVPEGAFLSTPSGNTGWIGNTDATYIESDLYGCKKTHYSDANNGPTGSSGADYWGYLGVRSGIASVTGPEATIGVTGSLWVEGQTYECAGFIEDKVKTPTVARFDGIEPERIDLISFKEWAEWCDELVYTGKGPLIKGSDTKTYFCILGHTGAVDNKPITGENYATYWKEGYGDSVDWITDIEYEDCSEKRIRFNGIFDTEQSLWEAAMKVCQVGRGILIWNGIYLAIVIDKDSDPVQLFTIGNIEEGSFKETFMSSADRASEIDMDYINSEDSFKRSKLIIIDSDNEDRMNKISLELFGINKYSEAYREGMYRLNQNKYAIRTIDFTADIDAVASTVGDIIMVQHDMVDWGRGIGGRIWDYTNPGATETRIVLDREIENPTGTLEIVYRTIGASGIDSLIQRDINSYQTGTIIGQTGDPTASAVRVATISDDEVPDRGDPYAIGTKDLQSKTFRIINIDKSSEQKFTISAVEHNPLAYTNIYSGISSSSGPINIPDQIVDEYVTITSVSASNGWNKPSDFWIQINFTASGGNLVNKVIEIYCRKDGDNSWDNIPFKTVNFSGGNYIQGYAVFNGLKAATTYEFMLRGWSSTKGYGPYYPDVLKYSTKPASEDAIENVVGLKITNVNPNDLSEFIGRDCKFEWKPNSAVDAVYIIKFYDSDGVQIGNAVETTNTNYTFTYTMNHEWNSGKPLRIFTIKIWCRSSDGTRISQSPAVLYTHNSVAEQVAGVSAVVGEGYLTISWNPSGDLDVDGDGNGGYQVHASDSSGFTPSTSTLKYSGKGNSHAIPISVAGTWYIKVGAYDDFSAADIPAETPSSYSDEYSIEVPIWVRSNDLELELMKMSFQYVSWAQFAIYDAFVDESKRDATDPSPNLAVIDKNSLIVPTDAAASTEYSFLSKSYAGITTVETGTGTGATNSLTDDNKSWFTNECMNLTLLDSSLTAFTVVSNVTTTLVVSGTPSNGAYSLIDDNPGYYIPFCSYTDSTSGGGNGYTKMEVSFDGGSNYETVLDTENDIDVTQGTNKIENTGNSYKVRITLKTDANGEGPVVDKFLVCTDPSPWRF